MNGLSSALWIAGGLTTLIGALVYAELAAAYPSTGGEYHFLSRAFGLPVAFLFAWARTTVIQTGAIAAVAFVFGDYAQACSRSAITARPSMPRSRSSR